jgi:hypothetical protein
MITAFGRPLVVDEVPDPSPPPGGVVLRVEATGVCMSDWHSWMGHEELPGLPHVPGHEMTGVVESVGAEVTRWRQGDRVIVPFSIGCGACRSCLAGRLNTCDRAFTPGFSAWGSFAQLVAIDHADLNLVRLPDEMEPVHAAALGCRFITAFRAVVDRGRLASGEWLSVYGCGGVGLSAVMLGKALGARVVASSPRRRCGGPVTGRGLTLNLWGLSRRGGGIGWRRTWRRRRIHREGHGGGDDAPGHQHEDDRSNRAQLPCAASRPDLPVRWGDMCHAFRSRRYRCSGT